MLLRKLRNRTLTVVGLVVVIGGGVLTLVAVGVTPDSFAQGDAQGKPPEAQADPSPDPIPLSDTGRLIFPVEADGVYVDDSGRPIPGGGVALSETCEADAIAVVKGGVIQEVRSAGTRTSILVGDIVQTSPSEGLLQVYRDGKGDLHIGCDPESWKIAKTGTD